MRSTQNQLVLATLLALITAVGPISTDMYLPAFPAMRTDLHGGTSSAPLTLAAWFGGIAVGQVVHGPLSDRFGRRAPLLLGTALYVGASAACALASSMPQLIAFRAVAAFGGAAGLVIPRVIVRDAATSGEHAARIVSRLQLIMSVVPMLAPTVGGFVVVAAGWRAIFWIAASYGLLCMLLTYLFLRETRPADTRMSGGVPAIALQYWLMLRDRVFATHVLTGGFATFGLFAFLGGAPAVFLLHFGMTPKLFGLMLVANGAGFALGTWLNVLAVRRVGPARVLTISVYALLAASVVMLLCSIADTGGLWGIEAPMIAITVALGCLLPDAAIGAIGPHPQQAGIASALYGTVIFAVGAFGTIGVGWADRGSVMPMAAMLLLGSVLAIVSSRLRPLESWH